MGSSSPLTALALASSSSLRWVQCSDFSFLSGHTSMAGAVRDATAQLIRRRLETGERVWFAGHWRFHWHAEAARASPSPWTGRSPGVVISLSAEARAGRSARCPGLLPWRGGASRSRLPGLASDPGDCPPGANHDTVPYVRSPNPRSRALSRLRRCDAQGDNQCPGLT